MEELFSLSRLEQFGQFVEMMAESCKALGSPAVRVLDALAAEFKPDVVVLDAAWTCSPALAIYFEHHFKARVLYVWTAIPVPPAGEIRYSMPSMKAYWPMGGRMHMDSLLDRVHNVVVHAVMTKAFTAISAGSQVLLDEYTKHPGPAGSSAGALPKLDFFAVTRMPRLHVATWLQALYPGPINPAFHNVGPLMLKDPKPLPAEGGLKP